MFRSKRRLLPSSVTQRSFLQLEKGVSKVYPIHRQICAISNFEDGPYNQISLGVLLLSAPLGCFASNLGQPQKRQGTIILTNKGWPYTIEMSSTSSNRLLWYIKGQWALWSLTVYSHMSKSLSVGLILLIPSTLEFDSHLGNVVSGYQLAWSNLAQPSSQTDDAALLNLSTVSSTE